jgi:hypothetical protein
MTSLLAGLLLAAAAAPQGGAPALRRRTPWSGVVVQPRTRTPDEDAAGRPTRVPAFARGTAGFKGGSSKAGLARPYAVQMPDLMLSDAEIAALLDDLQIFPPAKEAK